MLAGIHMSPTAKKKKNRVSPLHLRKMVLPIVMDAITQVGMAQPDEPLLWLAEYLLGQSGRQVDFIQLADGSRTQGVVLPCSRRWSSHEGSESRGVSSGRGEKRFFVDATRPDPYTAEAAGPVAETSWSTQRLPPL